MASLFTYLKLCQKFLGDKKQALLNPTDLIDHINVGRREVAQRCQCVRRLTPISGSIQSWNVTAGGSGYPANPTCTVSAPDFPGGAKINPQGAQATAQAITSGGAVTAVFSTYGGSGYFQPQLTIAGGTGAVVTPVIAPAINVLNPGQESYSFSDINVSMFPGVDSVFAIKGVAIIYANYRYTPGMYAFSVYQAMIRQYPFQYQYVPAFCSQYGQGSGGSFYAYPIPSQTYQWEFDCFCTPQDLIDDQSVDVIPDPWTDTVAFWAAAYAYLELQNFNAAEYYFKKFDDMTIRKSGYARPGMAPSRYGRY